MVEKIPEVKNPLENLEAKETEILDGQFKLLYLGKEAGNFRPTAPGFIDRLEAVRADLGLRLIFSPSLDFTKRTGSLSDDSEQVFFVGKKGEPVKYKDEIEGVVRTLSKADGGVVFLDELKELGIEPRDIALAAFNADCPFIVGYESEKKALFSLHAGLGCLHKPGEKDKKTIFQNLVKEYNLDPTKLKIFVTAGIQKCCYGRNDKNSPFPDVFASWGEEYRSVATKGARAGQESLDLHALIRHDIESAGVPQENIEVDSHCTCCDNKHWSNVKNEQGRNLILVRPAV